VEAQGQAAGGGRSPGYDNTHDITALKGLDKEGRLADERPLLQRYQLLFLYRLPRGEGDFEGGYGVGIGGADCGAVAGADGF
jgi:hypothetical protein